MAATQSIRLNVEIPAGEVELEGSLVVPPAATGVVLFVHGSGSSRHSPRNQYVARVLNEGRLATLLFDLLTPDEGKLDDITRRLRFDINLLARRTVGAADWLAGQPEVQGLGLGFFGSSTGAAAGLIAAAERRQPGHRAGAAAGRRAGPGGDRSEPGSPDCPA